MNGVTCLICHRPLTGLASTKLGMGPVCLRKAASRFITERDERQGDLFEAESGGAVVGLLADRVRALTDRLQKALGAEDHQHVQPTPPQDDDARPAARGPAGADPGAPEGGV